MRNLHDTLSRPSRPGAQPQAKAPGRRGRRGPARAGPHPDLVEPHQPGHTPIWSSRTSGNQGAQLVMQPNGNLAVVAPGGQVLWSAGTAGHSGAMLVLQPASSAPLCSTDTFRQTYADIQLAAHGWSQGQARQFGCLDNIWLRESKWNELAGSPGSAYGIPQASPGTKMAAAGPDWLTSPQTQIRWGEDHIEAQYGTPCQAWAHWQVHKNY